MKPRRGRRREFTEPRTVNTFGPAGVSIGGDSNAPITTEFNQHKHIHVGNRPRIQWPHCVGIVPIVAKGFQQREATNHIRRKPKSRTAGGPTHIVAGLGGVGKTQLAAEYAHGLMIAQEIDLLVWVDSRSREEVITTFARAAKEILPDAVEGDPAHLARRFVQWLSSTRKRWLVVLDDAAGPADLRGLWPIVPTRGHIVVTTRNTDPAWAGHQRTIVQIGEFSHTESISFLESRLADRPDLADDLDPLIDALGHLPIAIAQAAAFILDQSISCSKYCEMLGDSKSRLIDLQPEVLPDGQPNPVAATWALSIDLANRMRPEGAALPVLRLASVLDPGGIPEELLTATAVSSWLSAARFVGPSAPAWLKRLLHAFLQRIDSSDLDARLHSLRGFRKRMLAWAIDRLPGAGLVVSADVRLAIRRLDQLSLLLHDAPGGEAGFVRVHMLVQRATTESTEPEDLRQVVRIAADALVATWPSNDRDPELWGRYCSNASTLIACRPTPLWENGHAHPLLFQLSRSLSGEEGINYCGYLYTEADKRLGPLHRDTLEARHNLILESAPNNPAEAIKALRELLSDEVKALGQDHPETLNTRSTLAACIAMAGDTNSAITATEQLLIDQTRALGPNHRDTLTSRHNLAAWQSEAGDSVGAATRMQEVVNGRAKVLGQDHPDTLAARRNLAYLQIVAGAGASGVDEFKALVRARNRSLGPDHYQTLRARQELAEARGRAGDPAGAVEAYEALLGDELRVFGAADPNVKKIRDRIKVWQQAKGRI